MKPMPKRCAIYTRKSSDEGLDQEFNSLDAQREAGAAYVKSQASEGWRALSARYDDGGFSGGTMERPGLKALMADIAAGRVDVVVVYKIDRLTRSLADFARLVELFDRHRVSFVSVTQAFNTTTSMGRLTLNVLLSFAQFEREVTGERIRDKIAASKARGMWMGGLLPLGYDLPADASRTLRVNEAEAATVRLIFARYLELGSVHALEAWLAAEGIRSKRQVTRNGREIGGLPFSRGALFHLLRNWIYLGQIVHKKLVHAGNHEPILSEELFERVQAQLDKAALRRSQSGVREKAPLTGKIFDGTGQPMSPTTSRGASGRVYRYYVSAPLQQGRGGSDALSRLPAPTTEAALRDIVRRFVPDATHEPLALLSRVQVFADDLELVVSGSVGAVRSKCSQGEQVSPCADDPACFRLSIPVRLNTLGGQTEIVLANDSRLKPDATLIRALRRAHQLLDVDQSRLPRSEAAPDSPYLRRLVRLALLAPDIQQAILLGRQPRTITLERLLRSDVPLSWSRQRQELGFSEEAQSTC